MRKRIINLVILTALPTVVFAVQDNHQPTPAKDTPNITYIANDGFLIEAGGKKVLIDALFNPVFKKYLGPSPEIIQAMTEAREPFAEIDLILVTHSDGDHFDPNPVIACLRSHPGARLLAHTQVVDAMRSIDGFAQIENRIQEIKAAPGVHEQINPNGITVNILSLEHLSRPQTNNLAFLVELGGARFLHLGDVTVKDSLTYLEAYPFDQTPVDVLFLSYFDRSRVAQQFIACKIKPSRIIAMHVPPAQLTEELKKIIAAYPHAIVFKRCMERRLIPIEVDYHDLLGAYFGLTPPGTTPMVFARDIVSTDDLEHSYPSFSPDGNEVYWFVNRPPGLNNKEWFSFGLTMQRKNNRWSTPHVGTYFVFSPDGHLRFSGSKGGIFDICVAEKQGDHWSEPRCLNFLSRFPELQAVIVTSVARNKTLCLGTYYTNSRHSIICQSKLVNGEYTKPEPLPSSINLPSFGNSTPFIAPDESYLIFSSNRSGQLGKDDLYISFHDVSADTWTEPINMGEPINTSRQERLPMVSRDGKYLFFTRWTPDHDQDVFWVSAGIIEMLKAKVVQEQISR